MKRFIYSVTFAFVGSSAMAQEQAAPVNEIVVVGTRTARPVKDVPVQVRVVDRREIAAAGDVTAADAMNRVVGVQVDTAVRTGRTPQIQGFGSKHVLVLVDGRRVSGRLADDFDLSRIPAASIERIEVLKGASSVLYGSDAIGGVINIVTRKPKQGLHASAQASHDSLKRDEASASVSGGGEVFSARVDASHQKGPSFDLEPKDGMTTGSAYENDSVQVELAARPTDRLDLSATLAGDEEITDGVGAGRGNTLIDLNTKGVGRSARLASRYRPVDTGELRLDVGEARRTYKLHDDQRGGDDLDRKLDSKEMTRDGSLIGSLAYAEKHETTAGLEVSDQDFESNQTGAETKERRRTGTFVQHEWRPIANLVLVPGVRYDHDSQFDGHVSKAFTVRFDPSETVIVRASYGEGFRAPSFSELYLGFANLARGYRVQGNPDLEPEKSQSVQTSVAWQPNATLWLSLGGFVNRVEDLIATVRSQPADVLLIDYANIESVRNQGLETSARARLAERWTLGLDYTYLEARDETRGRMLEGRAMHSGAVQARYEESATGITAALTMALVGKRPFYTDTTQGTVTDWAKSYRAANVRLSKRFDKTFEVFTGVRNLTNEGQEKFNPVPPRSYFGGIGAEI